MGRAAIAHRPAGRRPNDPPKRSTWPEPRRPAWMSGGPATDRSSTVTPRPATPSRCATRQRRRPAAASRCCDRCSPPRMSPPSSTASEAGSTRSTTCWRPTPRATAAISHAAAFRSAPQPRAAACRCRAGPTRMSGPATSLRRTVRKRSTRRRASSRPPIKPSWSTSRPTSRRTSSRPPAPRASWSNCKRRRRTAQSLWPRCRATPRPRWRDAGRRRCGPCGRSRATRRRRAP